MQLIAVVGLLGVAIAGGAVWLLVRDSGPRSRAARARRLRRLTQVSAVVVLVTAVFLRPWYWDVALAVVVVAASLSMAVLVAHLEARPTPAGARSIVVALVTVVVASATVTMAGTAAVLDGAAVAGGRPVPVPHDGQVLARPVLYQLFWGPAWTAHRPPPALTQAVAFQRDMAGSPWATTVVRAGFGVRSVSSGGCWIDPTAPAPGVASSTASGPFPAELRRVLTGHRRVVPCPGTPARGVPATLPPDAVVALWLGPGESYALGGVSSHGAVRWPGRPNGLAVAGMTDGFATWSTASCARQPACAALPSIATPAYALSHEVVEAVTNPYGNGWYADPPVQWSARYFLSHGPTSLLGSAPEFQGEVADLCEPGQPDASTNPQPGATDVRALELAPFYRPGVGCNS